MKNFNKMQIMCETDREMFVILFFANQLCAFECIDDVQGAAEAESLHDVPNQ